MQIHHLFFFFYKLLIKTHFTDPRITFHTFWFLNYTSTLVWLKLIGRGSWMGAGMPALLALCEQGITPAGKAVDCFRVSGWLLLNLYSLGKILNPYPGQQQVVELHCLKMNSQRECCKVWLLQSFSLTASWSYSKLSYCIFSYGHDHRQAARTTNCCRSSDGSQQSGCRHEDAAVSWQSSQQDPIIPLHRSLKKCSGSDLWQQLVSCIKG